MTNNTRGIDTVRGKNTIRITTTARRHVWPALVTVALSAAGCAALSKGVPRQVQFFSLDRVQEPPPSPDAAPAPPVPTAPGIGLGRVSGALYLEDKLVYRAATFEVGYHSDLRWTEPPERYLARRLARALFEDKGLRRLSGGAGPVLDVELSALDEVAVGAASDVSVRAQLVASIRNGDDTLWEQTVTIDRPVATTDEEGHPRAVVDAMAEALEAAIEVVVAQAVQHAK